MSDGFDEFEGIVKGLSGPSRLEQSAIADKEILDVYIAQGFTREEAFQFVMENFKLSIQVTVAKQLGGLE